MTSTFKLTRAEFKKIFRSPSIFIMAIMLVATIFISLYIFTPYERSNDTIKYDSASNALEYYDTFLKTEDIDSKYDYDKKFLTTDTVISYYKSYNNYCSDLVGYYDKMMTAWDDLVAQTSPLVQDGKREELKIATENYEKAYKTIVGMENFPNIISTPLKDIQYSSYSQSNHYYLIDGCTALNDLIMKINSTITSQELINEYTNPGNNYESGLKKSLDNGLNFIRTTFVGLSNDFSSIYSNYCVICNQENLSNTSKLNMQNCTTDMLSILNTMFDYFKVLKGFNTPVIIINDSDRQDLEYKLENAIAIVKSLKTNADITQYAQVKDQLESLGINTTLNKLFPNNTTKTITQVRLSETLVRELQNTQNLTNTNKDSIIKDIENHKTDETLTNISKDITNYKLLENVYSRYVNNSVLQFITSDYDKSIYTKFYGYGFKDFNKYQCSENLSIDKYQIESNTYNNTYLTPLSFNQNSGYETNVFDYMYFTMELCTVIIIFFAVMLVCNLITGETESGTIKLLLVRPFKRSKILTAKLLATLFFVITFMLFSSVLSFVGGYFVYGYTTSPILTSFNGGAAFTISPLLMIIIDILFLLLDVIFFVLIALMIAVVFKNYAASISACLVILIANYALNLLFSTTFWYTLLPGMNLHMFKYFGNSFINNAAGTSSIASIIQSLLITGIESSMSFVFSLLIIIAYSIISIAVAYSVFKKRDY